MISLANEDSIIAITTIVALGSFLLIVGKIIIGIIKTNQSVKVDVFDKAKSLKQSQVDLSTITSILTTQFKQLGNDNHHELLNGISRIEGILNTKFDKMNDLLIEINTTLKSKG